MKTKKLLIITLLGTALSSMSFSDELTDMTNLMTNFSSQMSKVVPNSAGLQNVYSQAWIGNFFPSLPMHFALGVEGGISKFDMTDISKAGNKINLTSIPSTLLYPTLGFNGRMGGFVIPFDFGISCYTLNTTQLPFMGKNINLICFTIGGDVRFAILKGKGFAPCWSIGAGYYYSNHEIGTSSSGNSINFASQYHTILVETQISKTFLFFTPFIGFKGLLVKGTTSYNWTSNTAIGTEVKGNGIVSADFFDSFIPIVFGGFGLKMGLVQLDINGSYDFRDAIWNAGVSLRFQL